MPLDPNILLQAQPIVLPDPLNSLAKVTQIQGAQNANSLAQLQLSQANQAQSEKNGMNAAYTAALDPTTGKIDNTKLVSNLASGGFGSTIPGVQKTLSDADRATAEAQKAHIEVAGAHLALIGQTLGGVKDQPSYDAALSTLRQQLGPDAGADMPAQYDPNVVAQTQQRAMTTVQQLAQKSKDLDYQLGLRRQDEVERNDAFNNKISAGNLGVSQGNLKLSRDRFNADQAAPDADPTTVENVAQMIAGGRMAPLGQMALRSPQGMKIMARVAEINPDFRAQDFGTSSKAEKDFATGKQGNSVRSFNVALTHLDTLSNLSDALGNNDINAVNKFGNFVASQTGNAAPTNFEAAKKIVGDEIVKAIVGSGGGVHDRQVASDTISAANSPAQLKGVIGTYKELMAGQLHGLGDQYRATTGKDDFAKKYLSPEAQSYLASKTPGKPTAAANPGAKPSLNDIFGK